MIRLSLQEVGEVARLAGRRRAAVAGRGPTAHDVGVALGLSADEVERLLGEVRLRGASGGSSPTRNVILALASLAVFFLLVALGVYAVGFSGRPAVAKTVPSVPVAGVTPPPTPVLTPATSGFLPVSRVPFRPAPLSTTETIDPAVLETTPPQVGLLTSDTMAQSALNRFRELERQHQAGTIER